MDSTSIEPAELFARQEYALPERLSRQLAFIAQIDRMKSILRQTVLIDKTRRENDAEHSWHFAVMAMTLHEYAADKQVDIDRAVRMALVHDLIEIYAGDTFAYDVQGNQDKDQREQAAAEKLYALLPSDQAAQYRALWEEFDAMCTPDARYAAAIDRLQPFLNNALTQGHTWVKGHVSRSQVYARMDIVRTALPPLWDFVTQAVDDAVARGYLTDE